jgi:hypothetical protein
MRECPNLTEAVRELSPRAVDLDQRMAKPAGVGSNISMGVTMSLSAINSLNPNTLRAFAGIALTLLIATPIAVIYLENNKQGDDYPRVSTQYLSNKAPGCRAREDLDRLLALWDDEQARMNFLTLALQSGRCVTLDKGTEVVVEQAPFTSENFCVRPVGAPDCLWTNSGWLERPPVRIRGHQGA